MSDHDVIIIGAGSVGSPTAFFLAEAGKKVLVIESLKGAGQGQNKAAIGGTRATHSDPAKIQICLASLDVFSNWKEKTGTDIGWKKGGYCFPVYRENEQTILKGILPIQKRAGLTIDWVEPERVKEVVPGINPEGLLGGTYSPHDGQVSPLMASESFYVEAKKLGAEFKYNETVTGLVMDGNSIKAVKTDKGEYTADIVLNAAGGKATAICKMAGVEIPVIPDSHEAGISAPVEPFLDPLVVDLRPGPDGKTANFYFGQNHEGQIIFCYTPSELFKGENRMCTSEFMPVIARRLVTLIPRFKNLTIRRLWRGLYPMTPDGVAVVGKAPGVDNFYLGIGMCGQGFMMGPGVAQNLASLIINGKPVLDDDVFALLSPERGFYSGKKEALK